MADWEDALTARLKGDAPLKALVGDRVHWGVAPQGAVRPFLILQILSDPRPQTMKGPIGYRDTLVQADSYGESAVQAKAVRNAAIAALAPDGTFFGVRFGRGRVTGGLTAVEDIDGVGPVRRDSIDCMIWHT